MGFTAGPEYGGPAGVSLAMERGVGRFGRREEPWWCDRVVVGRLLEGVVNANTFVGTKKLNERAAVAIDNFIVTFLSDTTID